MTIKKIFDELKTIEVYKSSINYKKFKESSKQRETRLEELTNLISDKELELQNLIAEIETKRNELFFTERELDDSRNNFFALTERINQIEKELSSLKEGKSFRVAKIEELKNQIDELNKEKEEKLRLKNQVEEEVKSFEKELLDKENRLKEEELEDIKLKDELKRLNNDISNLQKEIIRDKNQLSYLTSQLNYEEKIYNDTLKRQEILENELNELTKQLNDFKCEIEDFKTQIRQKEREKETLEGLIKDKTDFIINEKRTAGDLRKKLQELDLKKERLQGFLNSSKKFIEDYGGFSRGTKDVLKHFDKSKVFGTLLDFIEVDKEYLNIFENIMGDRLELILVKDFDTAKEVVSYLNEKKAGSAYLYVIGEEIYQDDIELPPFIKSLTDRRDINSALMKFFQRVRLIDSLDKIVFKGNEIFVTPDGLVIDSTGVIHGGIGEKHNPFLTEKTKIKEMEEQLSSLNSEREDLFNNIKNKEKNISELDNLIKEKKDELANLNIELSSDKTDLRHKEEEIKRRHSKLEGLKSEQKKSSVKHTDIFKKEVRL